MPTVIEKRRADGRVYYYLVESARVDGKPRIVSQQYLGSAAEIAEKLAGGSAVAPVRSQHKRFGDLAAVWSAIERIGVIEVIDAVVPRRADAAASVGTYLALATANRVVDPCSKLGFADWWTTTAGPRWVKLPMAATDHRRFWEAMDRLSVTDLASIETELGRRIVAAYGLDTSGLVLDMTNFATYIDSGNGKAPIAQRGKAKQKRVDLRLVGLGLVVTRDGGIPLLSHAYPGDRPDVTQFPVMIEQLTTRFAHLADNVEELTLVYDAGQNSTTNHEQVEAAGIGFVGSLPPSDHPDLLAIARTRYRTVDTDRFPGLTHVDTTVTALGVTRRTVLTHSKTLHAAQSRGFDQTLAKAQQRLAALADKLARGKTRRPRTAVENEIATICKPRWVADVLTATLTGDDPADLRLSFAVDTAARKKLETRIFGKRILFTNRDTWPVAEIVAAYRSQSGVESGFRQLKDDMRRDPLRSTHTECVTVFSSGARGGLVMSIVGGFDVHRRQITFDYVDTDTGRVLRGRIAPACRPVLRRWLAERFAERTDVEFAVEACTGWRFVVEELEHAGIAASLAEPADTAAARGRKRRAKTDPADAAHLRELLAGGRLPTSWIPPQQVREMRAILELYKDLRDEHTAWVQRIHATLFHHGVPQLGTGGVSTPAGRARLESGDGLSPAGRQAVAVALRVLDALDVELDALHRQIRAFANRQPGCAALQAQYGVGALTSTAIWAMMGDTRRFSASRQAVRHTGLDVTVYSSDGKRAPGHLAKQGPPLLRWALYEAACLAAHTRAPEHDFYVSVKERIDHKRAAISVARKIARRSHHILRELGDKAYAAA